MGELARCTHDLIPLLSPAATGRSGHVSKCGAHAPASDDPSTFPEVFCNRCGAENPDDAAYCSNCGASVGRATAPPPVGPPPPPPGSTPVRLPPPATQRGTADPPTAPPGTITYTYTGAPPARSVRGLTVALTALFSIAVGLAGVQVGARLYLLGLLDDAKRAEGGDGVLRTALDSIDDAYAVTEGIQALAMLLALTVLVILIVWTWRARSNIDGWGARGARLPTGMAIGSWFIPAFWYLGPYWSMSDAYKGADPALEPGGDLRDRPRCRPALAWWIVWSIANAAMWVGEVALTGVAGTIGPDDSSVALNLVGDLDGARSAAAVMLAGEVLLVPAAILGIVAVRRMAARQQERIARSDEPADQPA